jgi:hypothetical protein
VGHAADADDVRGLKSKTPGGIKRQTAGEKAIAVGAIRAPQVAGAKRRPARPLFLLVANLIGTSAAPLSPDLQIANGSGSDTD